MSKFTSYDLAGPDPNPMTVAEVSMLKQLINKYKPTVIVNIGAERGTSTLAMLEESGSDTVIFSIDVNPCEGEFENAAKAGLNTKQIVRILGRSQEIGETWPIRVDFIWVDGDHSRLGVANDIWAWVPKLRNGGIVAFHDYFEGDPPPHNPSGAGEAVRELIHPHLGDRFTEVGSIDRLRAYQILWEE